MLKHIMADSYSPQPAAFKTLHELNKFLYKPLENSSFEAFQAKLLELRIECYKKIENSRKRPLIIYAANFSGVPPLPPGEKTLQGGQNFIDTPDILGFADLINLISDKNSKAVDILLHSPGGAVDSTELIVNLLRNKFDEVNFLIPHSAYSAATLMALSGNHIIMHPFAALGPIDPQIDGIPVRSILRGFEKVREEIAKEDPEALPVYFPLIGKYSIELLEICEDAEKLAKELASDWLKNYMFEGEEDEDTNEKIKGAVDYFSNYDKHLLHARPLTFEKLSELGISIELADEELGDLLWEAFVLLNQFFNTNTFAKVYESSAGILWGERIRGFDL